MDFQKVTYDGDLDEMEADDLRSIVEEYEEAQETNIGEFEAAKERIEGLEGEVAEKAEFKAERVERLTEVSPLDEEEAESFSLARIDSLIAEFTEDSTADEEVEDDEEADFDDMGHRGPTHDDEDGMSEYKAQVETIPGVVVDSE